MHATPWTAKSRSERVLLLLGAIASMLILPLVLYACGLLEHSHPGLLLANVFATPSWVMRKTARRLVNNCVFAGNVNRNYDDEYRQKGVRMGDTVTARLPQRYEVSIGAKMNPTPLTDQTVQITITDQSNIGFEYDSWAATLEVDDYMERYGNPAVDALINNIDFTGLSRCYKQVAGTVGTPGVTPGSTGTLPQAANQPYLDAVTELFDAAAPDPYVAMLNSNMHAYLVNGNAAVFNPSSLISANFRKGQFGNEALGVEKWFKTQNLATHVVGALGGTPVVSAANQVGSSITMSGGSNSVTRYWGDGDNINFAGCFSINPLTHQSTGRLKDFAVVGDTNSGGGGTATINITPSLIITGPFATASASPANNAAITTFGHASAYAGVSTPQGLIYNKDAFALVMADLVLPKGLWVSERISNAKLGVSVRFLKDHSIIDDVSPARLDTAHGWSVIRQELAERVCG
jgi:hypothetical protein